MSLSRPFPSRVTKRFARQPSSARREDCLSPDAASSSSSVAAPPPMRESSVRSNAVARNVGLCGRVLRVITLILADSRGNSNAHLLVSFAPGNHRLSHHVLQGAVFVSLTERFCKPCNIMFSPLQHNVVSLSA